MPGPSGLPATQQRRPPRTSPAAPSDGDGDGYTAEEGDCDDRDPSVHPGAIETCNGIDDDCDTSIDEDDAADASTWYEDIDGDGAGDATSAVTACSPPAGYVADGTDPCPLDNPDDIDGDGICNSADPDQDGDGCVNGLDPEPTISAHPYTYEADVEPLLTTEYGCTDCHSSDASWSGYFNLSTGSGYSELMSGDAGDDSVCSGTSYSDRVSSGDPTNSFFYHKLAGTHDCGDRMPQVCTEGADCVSDGDLALIYMWVCQGAPEN
jgi:hypothetical protein